MSLKEIIEKDHRIYRGHYILLSALIVLLIIIAASASKLDYTIFLINVIGMSAAISLSIYGIIRSINDGLTSKNLKLLHDDVENSALINEGDTYDVYKVIGKRKVKLLSVDLCPSGLWKAETSDGLVYIENSFIDDLLEYRDLYKEIEYEYEALLKVHKNGGIQSIKLRRTAR